MESGEVVVGRKGRPGVTLGWLAASLPFALWPVYCFSTGEKRWELVVLLLVATVLPFGSFATRKLFVGLYPIGLTGLVYDSMRFVKNVGLREDNVHVCDLHAVEVRLFGIPTASGRIALSDWFLGHSSFAVDLYAAIPYGTFIYVSVLFAAYLYRRDFRALRRFGWCFLLLNCAGFVTYHIYPAAPPWYFHQFGCHVDLMARASEGPKLHGVDLFLGTPYFYSFYARSNDVFGAVPSLHVAYPLLIAIEAWALFGPVGRVVSVAYALSMAFAAVYLDHHWVLDVVLGVIYTVVVYSGTKLVIPERDRTAPERPLPHEQRRGLLA